MFLFPFVLTFFQFRQWGAAGRGSKDVLAWDVCVFSFILYSKILNKEIVGSLLNSRIFADKMHADHSVVFAHLEENAVSRTMEFVA